VGFLDDGDDIAFRFFDDLENDALLAVKKGALADFGGGKANGPQITEATASPFVGGHLKVGDIGDILIFRVEADGILIAIFSNATTGQTEDSALEGGCDIVGG